LKRSAKPATRLQFLSGMRGRNGLDRLAGPRFGD
jgi:hypothetical protein